MTDDEIREKLKQVDEEIADNYVRKRYLEKDLNRDMPETYTERGKIRRRLKLEIELLEVEDELDYLVEQRRELVISLS
jgi:adenylosuccinate lyase